MGFASATTLSFSLAATISNDPPHRQLNLYKRAQLLFFKTKLKAELTENGAMGPMK